jgi:zinc ribbon protein
LVKYCVQCGKPNDDQAVFCTACGQKFPDQAPPAVPLTAAPVVTQTSSLYTAEMGTGAHKHMLTDVFLKDASGKVLLVARRQSILHQDYTIADGNESVTGFIESKGHLTHTSLNVLDANHNMQGSIRLSNVEQKGSPPNCQLEDTGGNKLGSIVFTMGMLGFSAVRLDGSRIFDARLSAGSGVRQSLDALEKRSYAIELLDPQFPLPTILAIIAALDHSSIVA